MKKFLLAFLIFFSVPGHADPYVPAIGIGILGLSIGIGIGQTYYPPPQPVYVPPQPAYIPAPVYYPYGYRYISIWDPRCYCYKNVLVSN